MGAESSGATALDARVREADERPRRLYLLVEKGHAEMDDILKDRITALKADRETARAAYERARGAGRAAITIDPARIEAFGRIMREQLTTGDVRFCKAYLGAIIDRIEVDDDQIRICGRKDVLE